MAITSVGSKITVKVPSIAAYYMKQIYWQQSVVVKLKAYSSNFASIPIKIPFSINNEITLVSLTKWVTTKKKLIS